MAASIEEKVKDYFKAELNSLGVKYFTKTESVNPAIEKALKAAESKAGGTLSFKLNSQIRLG